MRTARRTAGVAEVAGAIAHLRQQRRGTPKRSHRFASQWPSGYPAAGCARRWSRRWRGPGRRSDARSARCRWCRMRARRARPLARPARVEQPADLGGREIGIEQQPGARRDPGLVPARCSAAHARRCAGPARRWRVQGRPVARSHISAVSRWLVTPMAATCANVHAFEQAARGAQASAACQISRGSCSTHPLAG